MWVVGGPHNVVHPDVMAVGDADCIVHECAVDLSLEVLAGFEFQLAVDHLAVALKGVIHALNEMRHPGNVVFRRDELQGGEAFQYVREHLAGDGVCSSRG